MQSRHTKTGTEECKVEHRVPVVLAQDSDQGKWRHKQKYVHDEIEDDFDLC
jgi:hypothetical protein